MTAPAGLEVHYVDPASRRVMVASVTSTTAASLGEMAFEMFPPIRRIPSYAGQKHTPGTFWSATTGEMIDYESFLEAQHLTLLDFDTDVVGLASQVLMFGGADTEGAWRHVPDLFARRADGSLLVVDVKNPRHLGRDDVQRQAERTRQVCALLGWDYTMVGDVDAQRWANISWLAGFRRPPELGGDLAEHILALAAAPVALADLLTFVGDELICRPVVFHLCWRQLLRFDLDAPLRETTLLQAAPW